MMASWRDHHPGWEYRLWDGTEQVWENQSKIATLPEFCARADVIRYEILLKYGGVYVDADSVCLRPIDELLQEPAFVGAENELTRPGILANGVIGVPAGHPAMRYCIDAIALRDVGAHQANSSTGGFLLTEAWQNRPRVLPARAFFPVHWTGAPAPGDFPPFALQKWGSTTKLYPDQAGATDSEFAQSVRRNIALVEKALGF